MEIEVVFENPEELQRAFEAFEKRLLEEYKGDYYLSLGEVISRFIAYVEKTNNANLVRVRIGKRETIAHRALTDLYEDKEEERQKLYNEIMAKYVDEEKAIKLLEENLPEPEYFFDKAEAIAERLDLRLDRTFRLYYTTLIDGSEFYSKAKEIRKSLGDKYDEGKISKAMMEVYYSWVETSIEELARDRRINASIGFGDNKLNIYINKNDLLYGYDFDREALVKKVLEYMKKHNELYWVLEFDTFLEENQNTIEEFYIKCLNNKHLENFLSEAQEEAKRLLDSLTAEDVEEYIKLNYGKSKARRR